MIMMMQRPRKLGYARSQAYHTYKFTQIQQNIAHQKIYAIALSLSATTGHNIKPNLEPKEDAHTISNPDRISLLIRLYRSWQNKREIARPHPSTSPQRRRRGRER